MIDFSGRLARGWIVWVACVVALFVAPGGAVAEDEPRAVAPAAAEARDRGPSDDETPAESDKTQFLRFIDDGKGGGRLESAIVSYRNADGVTVHLVAALHVGEKSYYQGLAKTFRDYDALLYEMVKHKDDPPPRPGERTGSLIGGLQTAMSELLELAYQLDEIDYTRPNFVHADMDAEQFARRQAARGESFMTIVLRAYQMELTRSASGQTNPTVQLAQMLDALADRPNRGRKFKTILGRQFSDIEPMLQGLEGPDGSVILSERNDAAIKVLKEQLAKGKRNVGIFYGAAHLTGMDKTLRRMGFRQTASEWRVAWDVPPAPVTTTTRQATRAVVR